MRLFIKSSVVTKNHPDSGFKSVPDFIPSFKKAKDMEETIFGRQIFYVKQIKALGKI